MEVETQLKLEVQVSSPSETEAVETFFKAKNEKLYGNGSIVAASGAVTFVTPDLRYFSADEDDAFGIFEVKGLLKELATVAPDACYDGEWSLDYTNSGGCDRLEFTGRGGAIAASKDMIEEAMDDVSAQIEKINGIDPGLMDEIFSEELYYEFVCVEGNCLEELLECLLEEACDEPAARDKARRLAKALGEDISDREEEWED